MFSALKECHDIAVTSRERQRIKKIIEETATDADYKFKGKIGGVDRFADELLTQIDELK